jgi:hypothetical protein
MMAFGTFMGSFSEAKLSCFFFQSFQFNHIFTGNLHAGYFPLIEIRKFDRPWYLINKKHKMKTKSLVKAMLIMFLMAGMYLTVAAQVKEETVNLYESAGKKQTNKDFKPAPDKIETSSGTLKFELGAFPTEETVQKIYDEMDLQRATQAYLDFYPALSLYAEIIGQIRDFGFKTPSDIGVSSGYTPRELILTANNSTVYASGSLDLKIDGATVMDIPPGMFGTADDAAYKFLVDFGMLGPDKGKGGRYIFLPPGYNGNIPEGYFVIKSPSYRVLVMMRAWGDIGTGQKAVDYFSQNLKIYPYATGPRQGNYINTYGMGLNSLVPEDASAFEMLNEIIQYELKELFGAEQLGRLATLGIVKGQPFHPDERMRRILNQGATLGVAMSRAISFAPRSHDSPYWPDRNWQKIFLYNTTFVRDGVADIDARTLFHYSVIIVSPNLLSTTPGAGTTYLNAFCDKNGRYLDGSKNYKLHVLPDVPVKNFWAVTAYDPTTRSLLDAGGNINKSVGSRTGPEVNADGSVDVYFGPTPPKGKENNWVPTNPKSGFFLMFRFYGPLEGIIDKTWKLNDLELFE